MQIQILGSNQTEVVLSRGNAVFFSYETPVVLVKGDRVYKTSKKFSRTTSKHINSYIGVGQVVEEVDQDFIDGHVSGINFKG